MTTQEYETARQKLDFYPPGDFKLGYYGLGLAGESGEAVDKIKKSYRDGTIDNHALVLELGDALWYLTAIANTIGYSLEGVMEANIAKLASRRARGVSRGEGDNR